MLKRFTRLALVPCFVSALAACGGDEPVKETTDPSTTDEGGDGEGETTDETTDEGGELDAGKPDAGKPDAGKPDAGKPDAGKADAGTPAQPDASTPSNSDAGAGDAGKSDGGTPVASGDRPKPKCMKKDSQLLEIGDSYINWTSHTLPADLAERSGQKWRMEAQGGYSMGSGGLGLIPPEFDAAIRADPDAHTVILDGGGNDILIPDISLDLLHECQETGSAKKANCQKIVQTAIDAATKLVDRMAAAGIRDVLYFFYPHVPANTIISGGNPNEILDYALPLTRQFCESRESVTGGKLRCTFIDMVPVFDGQTGVFNEDIHPNRKGSGLMADKIWQVMTEKCIGQKGPKDCCES